MQQSTWDVDAVYWSSFIMSDLLIEHERKIYNIIDIIGDLGGTLEIFTSLIAIFIIPISYFGFTLKALKKLYLARTNT